MVLQARRWLFFVMALIAITETGYAVEGSVSQDRLLRMSQNFARTLDDMSVRADEISLKLLKKGEFERGREFTRVAHRAGVLKSKLRMQLIRLIHQRAPRSEIRSQWDLLQPEFQSLDRLLKKIAFLPPRMFVLAFQARVQRFLLVHLLGGK